MFAIFAMMLCGAATASAVPPANDDFNTPQDIDLNQTLFQPNAEATTQGSELLGCNDTQVSESNTLWYRITGTGGRITITTLGSNFDTVLAVDNSPSDNITCNDEFYADSTSQLAFNSTAGQKYLIQVGGCANSVQSGAVCGAATGSAAITALGNDNRAFAQDVAAGSPVLRSNYGASVESGESLSCGSKSYATTVWFHFSAPAPGKVTITATGPVFTNTLALYQGAAGTPIACAVGDSTAGTPPRVTADVTAGDYYIQEGMLTGQGVSTFNLQLEFTEDRDVDKDGETKDTDCDDSNPARHHGATDVAGNGVDEDCSGADAVPPPPDGDADGVPDASDKCKTENASRRDTNRDGCLDPLPLDANAVLTAVPTSRGVKIIRLRVSAPNGARVIVKCSRGCARTSKKATAFAARTIEIRALRNKVLRSGTRVRIWVTLSRSIGKYIQYRITRGGFKRSVRCLPPGSLKPAKTCT